MDTLRIFLNDGSIEEYGAHDYTDFFYDGKVVVVKYISKTVAIFNIDIVACVFVKKEK